MRAVVVTLFNHVPIPATEIDTPFTIVPIEGKGQGVIARRFVSKGELVLAEPPLIVQSPRDMTPESIRLALSQLPTAKQREYLSLANCHRKAMHALLGIFQTNSFPLGNSSELTGERADQSGIFLQASRFNSSCLPNIIHVYDENTRKENLYAVKDIAEGEELCVSYLAALLFHPRAERRAVLERNFKFVCTCGACSLEGLALQESDSRREEIGRLYEEIGCGGNPREVLVKVGKCCPSAYHRNDIPFFDRSKERSHSWMKRVSIVTGRASIMTASNSAS